MLLAVRGLLLSQRMAKVPVLANKAPPGLSLAWQKEFRMVPYIYMYVCMCIDIYIFSCVCIYIYVDRSF